MIFMRLVKRILFIALLGFSCGCGTLSHMDQLLVMGDYARDKNVQYKMVDEINAHYEALVVAINSGKIKNYPDQTSIRANFGEPITIKTITVDGRSEEEWLYRHAIPQKAKDKVYLYFDTKAQLIKYIQEKIEW
jgi:hypothetical protein